MAKKHVEVVRCFQLSFFVRTRPMKLETFGNLPKNLPPVRHRGLIETYAKGDPIFFSMIWGVGPGLKPASGGEAH